MIGLSENDLICDFAETYHIFDYKSLPASRAAILACGLPRDSRIKMRMRGEKIRTTDALVATVVDLILQAAAMLAGSEKEPDSVLDQLNGVQKLPEETDEKKTRGFDSPEALKEELKRLRGEM